MSKTKEYLANVAALVESAEIYVQHNGVNTGFEGTRIISCMHAENYFLAEGEESGEQYKVDYADVDLTHDTFYRLQKIDNILTIK